MTGVDFGVNAVFREDHSPMHRVTKTERPESCKKESCPAELRLSAIASHESIPIRCVRKKSYDQASYRIATRIGNRARETRKTPRPEKESRARLAGSVEVISARHVVLEALDS